MMIRDSSGRKVRALRVFYLAIKNMKELAEFIIKKSTIGYKKDDTLWVITIPAISSDSAKQFMREASIAAGIPNDQLKFVLEPEAAALYCKDRLMADTVPVGFKYIIADLGGGTTDICVHETVADDKLIEIYRATGKPVGGSSVDKEFEKFMGDLIGEIVWTEFSSEYPSVHVRFMNEFQVKKKHFTLDKDAITLRTDTALIDLIKTRTGKTFHRIIRNSVYADKVGYSPSYDEFVIYREVMEQFFTPSVNSITEKIRKVLENCRESNIQTILLVGGYSESPYLKERVETEFNDLRVIFSVNSRLAVLNGAVMMGWNPNHIIQRRSRYTYGFSVMCPFVDGKHPNYLRYIQDGKVWCCKVFVKLIEKGQLLEYGQTFKHKGDNTAISQELKHKERYTAVYRSTKKCPEYCTEEHGCNLIGNIIKYPPPEGWPDYWVGESCLIVGETEFTVKDINLTTGKEYMTRLDFL
ncbi:heat shock 70 kDa protein 12A-like [Mercenaria mercenaria]|uniref:heat shock 70 kDa protein 12A-like n=1 Tax=Mercenaria mercenaria TaxID=6596 RepID=UPI00234EBC89|nr:heat shock 70 kDa protein 12A-like [Mercenaria mercenaria]